MSTVVLVIPAYRPGDALLDLLRQLHPKSWQAILIIDDGSGPQWRNLFAQAAQLPRVRILRHAINSGKGAALKTGINHALCEFPDCAGVVTADADGQHAPTDIERLAARLAASPRSIVLGVRQFDARDIPFRSKAGNQITKGAVRLLIGQRLEDTQTGLRGIPAAFLPDLLRIPSSGYEFELDMLIACRHHDWPVEQIPIDTIYAKGNPTSHFNPLLDSLKIYFVLLRFSLLSLLTATIDNVVFLLAYPVVGSVGPAQVLSRFAGVFFNYGSARRAVFLSKEDHRVTLPRYLLLVAFSGCVSFALIRILMQYTALSPIGAKLSAEALLFLANFALQRDFVFRKRAAQPAATNWDRYYQRVPVTAHWTRRYTANRIVRVLRSCAADFRSVVEFGGANSCFLDRIVDEFRPAVYHVADTNRYGLDLLRKRRPADTKLELHQLDCLEPDGRFTADLVFSVGLIEHFTVADTRRAILSHMDSVRPGGWLLLSFPTPTWLYRVARSFAEAAGVWQFPDERPMTPDEALATIREHGTVHWQEILWPLCFTQCLILARKEDPSPNYAAQQ